MAADGLIGEGDNVVLDINGEKMTFVHKLRSTSKVRVGKFLLPAATLIGAPYGALFEVTNDGRALQRVLLPPADDITRITETEKNNSGLFDRNDENQKLTQEQIEELKKSGKAGTEIIEALISNSATFQNKTEFSQDKYRKRKAKKYMTYVTVRKPTSRIICQTYYDKTSERFPCLRPDTMAVMLSLANVAGGAKVLVADRCSGVLTAAAVERLGGEGTVCALEIDSRPALLEAVRLMNLSIDQRAVLFTASAGDLLREREALAERRASSVPTPGVQPRQMLQQQQHVREQSEQKWNIEGDDEAKRVSDSAEAVGAVSMLIDVVSTEAGAAAEAMEVAAAAPASEEAEAVPLGGRGRGGDASAAAQPDLPIGEMAPDAEEATRAVACNGAAEKAVGTAEGTRDGSEADENPEGNGVVVAGAAAGGAAEDGAAVQGAQKGRRRGAGAGYGSFQPRLEQVQGVLETGFDSCVVALPTIHPTTVLAIIWPLLAPSATFAIFSPWAQPLAEAATHLQASRNSVMVQLQESWLRPYQVLPARTHPHMACSGTGGYILSGIKVILPEATPLELQLQGLYQQPLLQLPETLVSQSKQTTRGVEPPTHGAAEDGRSLGRKEEGAQGECLEEEEEEGAGAASEQAECQVGGGGQGPAEDGGCGGDGGGAWGQGQGRGGHGNNWQSRGGRRGWGRGNGGGKRRFESSAGDRSQGKRQAR